jgi:diaminobutyrate-2-oxoglutarate transaminase
MIDVYSRNESKVRSYCRTYDAEFDTASNAIIYDTAGKPYLDFLSGCGSLNYGHNNPLMRDALLGYISRGGLAMSLDLHTRTKADFLEAFRSLVLEPRNLDYCFQFTGPTGANAVEAAIKLARKVTGRMNVLAFTNGFHGCSLGALSLTGNCVNRAASQPLLTNVSRMLYDGYLPNQVDTAELIEMLLDDPSSGIDPPAAIIFETIQGEGGLNCAGSKWAHKVAKIAKKHGALLIVDDIQAGCGRGGNFFSFEALAIEPDIVVMAKSLSGFGLPMSMLLLRREFDAWQPAEHNGTFRGNNHAFVTATTALRAYWSSSVFQEDVQRKSLLISESLKDMSVRYGLAVKGRCLMQGIDMSDGAVSEAVRRRCYQMGMIIETCGPHDEVLKLLPPLTIDEPDLLRGLSMIDAAIADVLRVKRQQLAKPLRVCEAKDRAHA